MGPGLERGQWVRRELGRAWTKNKNKIKGLKGIEWWNMQNPNNNEPKKENLSIKIKIKIK